MNDWLDAIGLAKTCRVRDGDFETELPEWCAAAMWLGLWCRTNVLTDRRLITFAVLPTRTAAAVFATIGSLIGGARGFDDALTWPSFLAQPPGSSIFWRPRNGSGRYKGTIVGRSTEYGSDFIDVRILSGPSRRDAGVLLKVSMGYLTNYVFNVDAPPARARAETYASVSAFYGSLSRVPISPKWIWADEAEVLLVARLEELENDLAALSLIVDGGKPVSCRDLLCMARVNNAAHAKVRVEHARGAIEGAVPLAVLNGLDAYAVREHLSANNILVILERSEYEQSVRNFLLQLGSSSDSGSEGELSPVAATFPRGFEITAHVLKR